jgi:hypothetical protein
LTGSGPKTDLAWLGTDGPPGTGFTAKHHSLVTYQGHGMVQQQEMRCDGCKLLPLLQFGLRLAWRFQIFEWIWPTTDLALIGTDGPPEAGFTAQHHSLVTCQGHGMVHQWQMKCNGCKLLQFGLSLAILTLPNFWLDSAQKLT